jgi:GGDEF domain-containing protein
VLIVAVNDAPARLPAGNSMMDSASVMRTAHEGALRDRNAELAGQLRAAAMDGDDAHLRRLLSELLRCRGLTRNERVALQLKALLNLIQTLRCAALLDELTGLYNARGFLQGGTRVLDVAAREGQDAYLIYFEVNDLGAISAAIGRAAAHVLVRQIGNFMRDLFPSYGVYEALGRLSAAGFAALTTNAEYASRSSILLRTQRPQLRGDDLPPLTLSVGVAHFHAARPIGIDELLATARQSACEPNRSSEFASYETDPPTQFDANLTASRR